MSTYYCHNCAIKLGLLNENKGNTNLTGSTYLLEKFIKHTNPTRSYDINSIFNDPNYYTYKEYIVDSLASGSLEIDDANRKNVIYCAGRSTGLTIKNGNVQIQNDAVKVVLHENDFKIHSYPTSSQGFSSETCSNCGDDIIK